MWQLYGLACKRYDSVANEWDVAWFLDDIGPLFSMEEEYEMLFSGNDLADVYDAAHWANRPPHPFFHPADYQLSPPPPYVATSPVTVIL